MSEFSLGDQVRVRPEAAPFTGQVGLVVQVVQDDDWLSVQFGIGPGEVTTLAYRTRELELVSAVVTAPRVVTVVV